MVLRLHNPDQVAYTARTYLITCGRGGIGRRAALRSLWGNTRGGSSPLDRTIHPNVRSTEGASGGTVPGCTAPQALSEHRLDPQNGLHMHVPRAAAKAGL
jgi:hypothetical protein